MLDLPKRSLAIAHFVIMPNAQSLYANDIIMRWATSQGASSRFRLFSGRDRSCCAAREQYEDQVLFVIFPAKIRASFTIAL